FKARSNLHTTEFERERCWHVTLLPGSGLRVKLPALLNELARFPSIPYCTASCSEGASSAAYLRTPLAVTQVSSSPCHPAGQSREVRMNDGIPFAFWEWRAITKSAARWTES